MLPMSRSTTYVSGSPPAISAQDLNDLQDYLSGLYANGYTIKGLKIDGVGGNSSTQAAQLDLARASANDVPLALYRDYAGNVRCLVDHNGYPMGRGRGELRQEWNIATASQTDGRMCSAPAWSNNNPTSAYPSNFASLVGGTTGSTDYYLQTAQFLTHFGNNFLSVVLEAEVAYSTITATNTQLGVGFSDGYGFNGNTNAIWFQRPAGGTNWQGFLQGQAAVDLGVAPVAGSVPSQRLRLEVHGSASPYGSGANGKARFFINEVLKAEIVGAIPSAGMVLNFAISSTASVPSGGTTGYYGPFVVNWNRALSLPAL